MKRSLALLSLLFFLASAARAQDDAASQDFQKNCATCHTIGGGRLTGPDLKDVAKRRDKAWVQHLILDPKAMLTKADPTFMELMKESRAVVMPNIAGMTPERAAALIQLLEAESQKEKSRFAGLSLIDRPLLPSDIVDGEALFLGTTQLKNGGPSCLSCHTVGGMKPLLGGGTLGPDLSDAFARLGGEKSLAAWLVAPATATMQPIFQKTPIDPQEVLPLVAYLKDASMTGRRADTTSRLYFLIFGIAGATALFIVADTAWGRRFRSVRRTMVEGAKLPVHPVSKGTGVHHE